MKNKLILSVFFAINLLLHFSTFAQKDTMPLLPDFKIETKNGLNFLSFYNIYDYGIKIITVKRSNDSVVNFTNIGTLPNTKKGNAVFVDAHPLLGKNWYQIHMEFTSGVDFSSNIKYIKLDSADLKKQTPIVNTVQLQEEANKALDNAKSVEDLVKTQTPAFTFTPSAFVFTNPFTGHINIELKDAYTTNYKVDFFDNNKKKVLAIPRVKEPVVILDKRNFNSIGLYSFKLYKNGKLLEEGFINIY
ncbi:MAG TPA: hypothetical protein PKX92_07980 [Edaphocola sp.]|nr:hypothetical protein [Edaphocola sp.]